MAFFIFLFIIILLLKIYSEQKTKPIIYILLIFIIVTFIFKSVNNWNYNYNKYTINSYIPNEFKLKSGIYSENNIKNFKFPFILKPIICAGTNRGVRLINNQADLDNFRLTINPKEKYMIQEFYLSKYEVGLLYEKIPYLSDGKIVSIVLKERVDGEWKPLKCENKLGSGVNCSDQKEFVTKELEDIIRKISNNIPGFYMGRFDIGFDNIVDFKNGENFKIFELNGVMGYDLLFSVKNFGFKEAGLLLRWVLVRILTGIINIITSNISIANVIKSYDTSFNDYQMCRDVEKWFEPSPA